MTIRQLSIFIDDKAGSLVRVLDVLSQSGHQILTSTLADTQDFSIFRVLCTDADQAYLHLREAGFNVMLTDVMALMVPDEPGSAARAIRLVSQAGISIRYMYSFLLAGKGILVLRTDNTDRAKEIILLNKLEFATEAELDALVNGLRV